MLGDRSGCNGMVLGADGLGNPPIGQGVEDGAEIMGYT
jgi:hypothetical protein